ncbi:MAG: ArsR family transcriptional regulator [Kiritimatiellae bacterium]|nr:ArsR family transcriptional regulator [Kiritimatiellia bacterium]
MASRIGPLVYYRPGANRSVPDSGQLLRVILKTFSDDKNAHENIFRYATAFTHPRRILIVKTLSECSMQPEEMVSHMNISFSALIRHVRKLVARGFLKRGVHGYICSVPRHKFARFLLDIARYT